MISSFDEFVRVPTDNSARESTWKRSLEHIPTSRPISLVLFILYVGIGMYKKTIQKHLGISNIWIRNHLSLLTALLEMNTIWPWMTFDNTAQISNAKTEGRKDLQSCNIIGEAVNGTGSWEIHSKYNFHFNYLLFLKRAGIFYYHKNRKQYEF